jgi:hypothetical protein
VSNMGIIVKCNEKTLLQNDVTGLELVFLGYLTLSGSMLYVLKKSNLISLYEFIETMPTPQCI